MKLIRCKDCKYGVKKVLNGLIWVEFDSCSYGKEFCDNNANRGIAKVLEERDNEKNR